VNDVDRSHPENDESDHYAHAIENDGKHLARHDDVIGQPAGQQRLQRMAIPFPGKRVDHHTHGHAERELDVKEKDGRCPDKVLARRPWEV
jgi:hypothetical protein